MKKKPKGEHAMLRVFLAEDESMIRETLRDTVPWEKCGYTFVGESGDGEMALPLIRQTKPDVLIADIRMPFMDGLALSKLVLQEFPRMKIIIISGYDEFEYAQQAIGLGVERYLLKPISKNTLLTVLEEVKGKIEGERAQQNYLVQFRQEAQDYEQYARRRFFEQIAAGQLTVQQIYERAEQLDLDLRAEAYAVAYFSITPEKQSVTESYSEPSARIRDGLVSHFLKYPEYILFRYNLGTYAVLIKSSAGDVEQCVRKCVDTVRSQYESYGPGLSWHVAVSRPTRRLSMLSACCEEVTRLWAYRYILPGQHLLSADTVSFFAGSGSEDALERLDVAKVEPEIISGVLRSATAQEVPGFVDEYIHSMGEALGSMPFCQYLMLSVRFAATAYVRSLEVSQEEYIASLSCLELIGQNVTVEELSRYMTDVLLRAIAFRDSAAGKQYRSLLKEAVDYIDQSFTDEELSLNKVAKKINISPNYLSAVFSQEMGLTFVEYVTAKRMEKAKELLRQGDRRSGEVAAEVGYRDPHYFSFLFKKTQGCTPRDYRAGRVKK